jgi:hypothetical protein
LFPAEAFLDRVSLCAFAGFVVTGVIPMVFVTFMLMVEANSTPGASPVWIKVTMVTVLTTAVHMILEVRALGPLRPVRWLVFGLCMVELAAAPWFLIHDPIGRSFFSAVALLGGANFLAARLVSAWAEQLRTLPLGARIVLAAVAWGMPYGIGMILLVAGRLAGLVRPVPSVP